MQMLTVGRVIPSRDERLVPRPRHLHAEEALQPLLVAPVVPPQGVDDMWLGRRLLLGGVRWSDIPLPVPVTDAAAMPHRQQMPQPAGRPVVAHHPEQAAD